MEPGNKEFVLTYKNVKESIDLYENSSISTFISQRSDNKDIFKSESFPQEFQQFHGKKVYWSKTWKDGTSIPYDEVPFVIIGHEDLECHHGPKHKKKLKSGMNSQGDHSYDNKKKRRMVQHTKKMNCTASIKVKVVIKFPEYKVSGQISEFRRKQLSAEIKSKILEGNLEKEGRFYLFFPEEKDHENHLTGAFAGYCQPPAEKIRKKISNLAMSGMRKVSHVKLFLDQFVTNELFPGIAVSKHNRRYYPSDKEIRNHIYAAVQRSRFSLGDQQNLASMVDAFKVERPADNFFIRTANDESIHNDDDSIDEVSHPTGFLFVHQTEWQKRLLCLYGKELCLLDATYNTSKYDLPLFFICVQSNVGYSICGTMILANESKDCIAEGLAILRTWNQNWEPSNFMTDFDEREITAVEEIFPGCSVYLCQFHREQAWDRWLREIKNGVSTHKDEVVSKLRKIANSSTPEDYEMHLAELTESDVWQDHFKLQSWLQKKWLPNHHRWVFAFRKHLVNVRLNTTNGLERKHQDFKKNYLAHYGDGTLTTLVTTLINKFLPEAYDDYMSYNVKSLDVCKRYHSSIPSYLVNKPKMLIDHCMTRLPPHISKIVREDIIEESENQYAVRSADSGVSYSLCLTEPSCECMDWGKNHLPCKHMLAVFSFFDKWDSLPSSFRDCPHLNLDPVVLDVADISFNVHSTANITEIDEADILDFNNVTLDPVSNVQDNTQSHDFGKHITLCAHLIKDLQNNIYRLDKEEKFTEIIKDLTNIFRKTEAMVEHKENLPVKPMLVKHGKKVKQRNILPLRKNRRRKIVIKQGKKTKKTTDNIIIDGTFDLLDGHTYESTKSADEGTPVSAVKNVMDTVGKSKGKLRLKRKLPEETLQCETISDRKKSKFVENKIHSGGNLVKENKELSNAKAICSSLSKLDNMTVSQLVNGLWSLPKDFYIPVAKVAGEVVHDTDIRSLRPNMWLTDKVMDSYLALLVTARNDIGHKVIHFVQTKMTGIINRQFNARKDVRRPISKLSECEMVVGIYHRHGHWTLVVIEMQKGEVFFYNPSLEQHVEMRQIVNSWTEFAKDYSERFDEDMIKEWTIKTVPHTVQTDAFNCGVFCLMFAEAHMQGNFQLMSKIKRIDLEEFRRKIAKELMLYEVFLTGCCPKCGFEIADDPAIKCVKCDRFFHFKPYCCEDDVVDFGHDTEFTCRLCRIQFWDDVVKKKYGEDKESKRIFGNAETFYSNGCKSRVAVTVEQEKTIKQENFTQSKCENEKDNSMQDKDDLVKEKHETKNDPYNLPSCSKDELHVTTSDDTKELKYNLREKKDKKRSLSYIFPPLKGKKNVHCICLKKDDGRKYWQCETCEQWFHPTCLGYEGTEIPTRFQCPDCEKKTRLKTEIKNEKKEFKDENFQTENLLQSRMDTDSDDEEESNDKKSTELIPEDFCFSKIEVLFNRLRTMMQCSEKNCDEVEHLRHHEFISKPLDVCEREKTRHCFGSKYITGKIQERICELLCKEFICSVRDKKHPYSIPEKKKIRNLPTCMLQDVFEEYGMIAFKYMYGVCLKEIIIWIVCQFTKCPYELAEHQCQLTEVCIRKLCRNRLGK